MELHAERLAAVAEELQSRGAQRVLDLGCGDGRLIELLLEMDCCSEILGLDISPRALAGARDRLARNRLTRRSAQRVTLIEGSVAEPDPRLVGFDAAAVVEVVEHLEPTELAAFEAVLFGYAHPVAVVLTTPNIEYNARYPVLVNGTLRHPDHRFEWTRAEFQAWANGVGERRGYRVKFTLIGPEDPALGAPTQMGIFSTSELHGPVLNSPGTAARHDLPHPVKH